MSTTDPRAIITQLVKRRNDYAHDVQLETEPYYDCQVIDVDAPAAYAALTAVLDLHKPFDGGGTRFSDGSTILECEACPDPQDGSWRVEWPCPTVRAITTALGGGRG